MKKPTLRVTILHDADLEDDIDVLLRAFLKCNHTELTKKAFPIASKKIFEEALACSAVMSEFDDVAMNAQMN